MRAQRSTAFTNHAIMVVIANRRQALAALDNNPPEILVRRSHTFPPKSPRLDLRSDSLRAHKFMQLACLCHAWTSGAISQGRRRTSGAADRFQCNASLPEVCTGSGSRVAVLHDSHTV